MTEYFFLAIIILLPFQFALNVGQNIDLVTTRVLVPVLFLLWILKSLARKKIWIPNKAEMWLVAVFLFLSAISLVMGIGAAGGLRKLLYFLTIFPLFFVAADIFRSEKWRKCGIAAIVFGGVLASLIGLFQFALPFFIGTSKTVTIWEGLAPFFLGNSFGKVVAANSSWLVNIGGKTQMRAFGFFPDPHNFAFFINLCLFAGLGYFFSRKKAGKLGAGAGIILMALAMLLSFSRGAYLGAIAGALFFAVVFLKRSGTLKKVLVAVAAVAILATVFNYGAISKRIASSLDPAEGSNAERLKNWNQAVEIIRTFPLAGVGLGNYSRMVDATAGDRSSIYAHNLFLDIAAETGVLNAIIFLVFILVSFWRNIRNGSRQSLGLAAGLVAFSVHSLFDTALYSPQVLAMFLVIIALGLSSTNIKAKNENGKTAA